MNNFFGQRESIELTNPILRGENEDSSDEFLEGDGERGDANSVEQELNNLDGETEVVTVMQKNDLGTIMGVYLPVVMSILGLITFVRIPWIVGNGGLLLTLLLYSVAFTIVVNTTLSISAIASNGKVKAGGAYFMISRVLGPEFGGSIGIIFYLANVANAGSCAIGLAETLLEAVPSLAAYFPFQERWVTVVLAESAVVLILFVCFLGANIFSKTLLLQGLSVLVSIVAIGAAFCFRPPFPIHYNRNGTLFDEYGFTGWNISTFNGNLWPDFSAYQMYDGTHMTHDSITFMVLFGLVVPSVSGIMAGANMSGDLKRPSQSIPRGTLAGIGTIFLIYLSALFLVSGTVEKEMLRGDYFIFQKVVWNQWIVAQGILCACVSSIAQGMTGASRILQAIARDDLVPGLGVFAQGTKRGDEPIVALLFTFLFVSIVPLVGNLNNVNLLVSMFFLLTYGTTNFACFLLSITGAPNWRPTFGFFSWPTSLFGALVCLVSMFVISAVSAGISIIIWLALFGIIHYRAPVLEWGDISQALIYHQVRKYLLRLAPNQHVKFWRPSVLCIVDDVVQYDKLMEVGNDIKKGGLYVVGRIVLGDLNDPLAHQSVLKEQKAYESYVHNHASIKGFAEVLISNSARLGVCNLLTLSGIGGMRPNTVLLKYWKELDSKNLANSDYEGFDSVSRQNYLQILSDITLYRKNILIARNFDKLDFTTLAQKRKKETTIDLWILNPFDLDCLATPTMNYMLQLGHILHCTSRWKKISRLRLLAVTLNEEEFVEKRKKLEKFLVTIRIDAEIEMVSLEHFMSEKKHNRRKESLSNVEFEVSLRDAFDERPQSGLTQSDPSELDLDDQIQLNTMLNEVIRVHSADSGMVFIPFEVEESELYFHLLDIVTEDISPCLCIHGVDSVITLEL